MHNVVIIQLIPSTAQSCTNLLALLIDIISGVTHVETIKLYQRTLDYSLTVHKQFSAIFHQLAIKCCSVTHASCIYFHEHI